MLYEDQTNFTDSRRGISGTFQGADMEKVSKISNICHKTRTNGEKVIGVHVYLGDNEGVKREDSRRG